MVQVIPKHVKDIWDKWNIRGLVILSLTLQTILIFLGATRKRTSRSLVMMLIWSSYLLADWSADLAMGLISKNQAKNPDPHDPPQDKNLMALWQPFLLLHLGGPDTITAYALADNALWHRRFLALAIYAIASIYVVVQSLPNTLWRPISLLFTAGVLKYQERTTALFIASSDKFRGSQSLTPDLDDDEAKLTDDTRPGSDLRQLDHIEKRDAHLRPSKLEMPKRDLTPLEILQYAFWFFNNFRSLVVNKIFNFNELDESQELFGQLRPEEAWMLIEVELGFIYEGLFTKVAFLHSWLGAFYRLVASVSLVSAFCIFYYRPKKSHEFDGTDIVITYMLFIVGIALDLSSFLMLLPSDWTFAVKSKLKDDPAYGGSRMDHLFQRVLYFKIPRWKQQKGCNHNVLTIPFLLRRWVGVTYAFNFIAYSVKADVERIHDMRGRTRRCLWKCIGFPFNRLTNNIQTFCESISRGFHDVHRYTSRVISLWPRNNPVARHVFNLIGIFSEFWFNVPHFIKLFGIYIFNFFSINDLLDEIRLKSYVSSEPLTRELLDFIFTEVRHKSRQVDSQETARRISSARGEMALRRVRLSMEEQEKLMDYVENAEYDESLLLWHIATEICYQLEESTKENRDHREFSKILSDYLMYLLIMQPQLMSEIAGIGKIRFRDTMAEADKFFRKMHIKNARDAKKASKTIRSISTDIKPMDVKGGRSKSVLFDASILAKTLQELQERKWETMSKIWLELLCYAACHSDATARLEQLGAGGEFINFVWLLMAHFGLGG